MENIGYEQQLSRFKTIIPPDRYKIKEICIGPEGSCLC
ncbi:hypothetical protein M072_0630 [Bacteroides fragilis str. DS-208]|nr:hypothetical protein M072_0630 [Bacteroides fragilis str. DS-208]